MAIARRFLLLLFLCSIASASPKEVGFEGDSLPDDSRFLSMTSRATFNVTDRLKKNVDFWVRIYTYYDTNQGLIHDAKYVDIIYEIVNLDNPSSRTGEHQVKKMKKKWHDLLLTLHHKQNHPERSQRRREARLSDVSQRE